MSSSRTRMAAVAGSLALSLSMVSAPGVLAQDGPEATIEGLMTAVETLDFESLPTYFCDEYRDQAAVLDLGQGTAGIPAGMDTSFLLDAVMLDVEITSMDVLSETDTEAVVQLEASWSLDVDIEAITPFIEIFLMLSGRDVTPETIEAFIGPILADFQAQSTQISEEITLVPGEAMPWLVCSDLGVEDLIDMAAGSMEGTADADGE